MTEYMVALSHIIEKLINQKKSNQIKSLCRQQVQNTGHTSKVAGHFFTNIESILNICKS